MRWFHGALGRAEGLLPASGPGPTTRQNWQWGLHHPGVVWALCGAGRQQAGGQAVLHRGTKCCSAPSTCSIRGQSAPPSTQPVLVLSPPASCPSAQARLLTSRFPAFLPLTAKYAAHAPPCWKQERDGISRVPKTKY